MSYISLKENDRLVLSNQVGGHQVFCRDVVMLYT